MKLAEIAAAEAEKIRQAHLAEAEAQRKLDEQKTQAQLALFKSQQEEQLAKLKIQQDEETERRNDEFERFKASLQDVDTARLGFFIIFYYLMIFGVPIGKDGKPIDGTYQLINLTLGALVAAFTTVVSFWLGSSQGSRLKDAATADIQLAQSQRMSDTIKSQANTIKETQSTSLEAVRQSSAVAKPANIQPAAVKRSNFPKCVDIVLAKEGGFSNDPNDPGGATNFGITQKTLSAWLEDRGQSAAAVDDVKKLTRDTACEIY